MTDQARYAPNTEVEQIMHGRKALATTLAVGMAIGPATAAVLTLGALVSPAVAQGSRHGHGHHATTNRRSARHNGGATTSANARTITLHGIITGTPTSTSLEITRVGHGRENCLTTPKTETIVLDGNTTFSTVSIPNASLGDLVTGDAVAITLNVPAGTAPLAVAASAVADLGAAAPVTRAVRGTATSGVTGTSFTVALGTKHTHQHRGHGNHNSSARGHASTTTSVTVNVDTNTVFVDPGNPAATIQNIASGDRLIIVWSAPPGTALSNMPAASKVVDLGPPRPIRYRAEGVAASGAPTASISLTVNHLHPNFPPTFADGSTLTVQIDSNTVFTEPGNPTATIGSIAQGDRVIVVWRAAPGTAAVNLPAATRVTDLGH